MKAVWSKRASAVFLFAMPFSSVSAQPTNDACSSYFESGTGGDMNDPARKLHVDLGHGVSMMMLPGFVAAAYSVSLAKGANGQWLLTYVIDNPSQSRPYWAAVPFFSAEDAQWIEKVWATAVAEAKPKPVTPPDELGCIRLDGMSYVFSVNGRQANNWAGQGALPRQLIEIANTLRLIAADTKSTGHPVVSSLDDLSYQLNHIESELKINSH